MPHLPWVTRAAQKLPTGCRARPADRGSGDVHLSALSSSGFGLMATLLPWDFLELLGQRRLTPGRGKGGTHAQEALPHKE